MNNKLSQKWDFFWLQLTALMLLNSLTAKPLNAQTIESGNIPNSNLLLSQQLPPSQDFQAPPPSSLPLPQLPPNLPPPTELLPPTQTNPLLEQLPPDAPKTIVVKRFEVVGSTVFSPAKLAEVTNKFTNRPISLAELFQVRSEITDLYVKNGYITSGAYIPPQTIDADVVKIQIVEGKLEDIEVVGTRRLNPDYVRSRIAIASVAPINQKQLLEALRLLQLNPLIQNLSAELSAGSRPGTNILQLTIKEAKTFSSQIALDNGRSPSVGSFRRRLNLSEANLSGRGDSLNLSYSNTDGSNGIDASYTLPLNPRNGTLTLSFSNTDSNVIERPFNVLDIQSNSRYYDLTYRQPILQSSRQELALGLTVSHRESQASYVAGERLPFPALGADDDGRTRVSALRFFQEWTSRNTQEVFAVRSQFSQGLGGFLDATVRETAPDSRFFAWQGQAQWARLLAPDTLLIVRGNAQLASRTLLATEQLGLGGGESVRGYRQDYLLTDNGTLLSTEVYIPIVRSTNSNGVLQIIPFLDLGIGWNNSGRDDPNTNTLLGTGLGLRWTQNNLTARFDWGIPLISVDSQDRTWQENGLYFSLQYNPF
ncbi:MAG TPA: ShlB/FhaC/HecB family hemolysin secretion/activation protein [Nostocaceae cyanobacterium]|nr:ShlB/FhaC/HecB family hemolysin secretion/activation protein [Nostocaceae cyanobacterium]